MNSEPQAYLNGRWLPHSQATISLADAGFVQGTTVAEQLRTFGGKLFRLDEHLQRLQHSLAIVDVDPGVTGQQLAEIAQQLAAINYAMIDPADDLGLAILVTPGEYSTLASGHGRPTVCLHTYGLPFQLWADKYQSGQSLVTTDVQQVPQACWPAQLKCRSRMHYYLADRAAAAIEPGARALLLDQAGQVTETTTTNVILYRAGDGLLLPPGDEVLPGISLRTICELAQQLNIPLRQQPLFPADVAAADEVLLSSTTSCLLPATRFNGQPIGDGRPGVIFQQLVDAWGARVGLDICGQARRFRTRATWPTP